MSWNLEQNKWIDIQQSVWKKTDSFSSWKEYKKIQEQTKQKVEILEILDDLEFSEENQKEILKKILKYNLVNEVKEALDKEEVLELIKQKELNEKTISKKNIYDKLSLFLKEKEWFKEEQTEQVQEQTEQVQEQTEQVQEQTEQVQEQTEQVQEQTEQVQEDDNNKQEHENKSKEFYEYKEKVDNLNNSIKWLDKKNSIYWNTIKEWWELDDRIKSEKLSFDEIKKETLKILAEFKQNPEKLQAVVKDLGWVNSAKYKEFRESIIAVDSDFASILPDIEVGETLEKLSTREVIDWVEKENWWVVDIELWENPPMYKMRVIWSEYWFSNEIDKSKLAEITSDNKEELNEIYDNWFKILKDFKSNFSKQNYDISKLDNLYSYFDIDSNLQINPSDLQEFREAKTQDEKLKIFSEKIKPKIDTITKIVKQKQQEILKAHNQEIKELLEKQIKAKETQKQTLDFLHKTGFDLIPQNITNELIAEIKSNVIQVKWLNIDPHRLDLKNWIFGNSWLEANSNQIFKENIIKFLNKLIYWEVNPKDSLLKIESFTSVTWATINPTELQDILKKQWVKSDMYWDINKMRENLRK